MRKKEAGMPESPSESLSGSPQESPRNARIEDRRTRRMKARERSWHIFTAVVLVLALVLALVTAYARARGEEKVRQELTSGSLPRSERGTNGIMILCYHRILRDTAATTVSKALSNNRQLHDYALSYSDFESQMNYLREHKIQVITLERMTAMLRKGKKVNRQYAVIAFDDFDQTVYDNAYPLLKKLKMPFSVFIVSAITGEYDKGSKMATWSEIKQLSRDPLVSVGAHTHDMHYQINNRSALTWPDMYEPFTQDYRSFQKSLRAELGKETIYFAYPYGQSTTRTQRFLTQRGMITFGLDGGVLTNAQITDRNVLKTPLSRVLVGESSWNKTVKPWIR